jgi:hypothetical protein
MITIHIEMALLFTIHFDEKLFSRQIIVDLNKQQEFNGEKLSRSESTRSSE